jgi:glycosidase
VAAAEPVHRRAGWIADTVVYGVVPAFYDPPGFAGVAAKLNDLADLGVGALWLSPIMRTLPGNFGYAVTDYCDLRPEYGTKDDFRTLIQAAHERGIRVLMDFVPNHTSVEHPWFRDAAANGESSSYWDYYDRDPHGNPTHYFSWTGLPNLNYDNPEVGRLMLEGFTYWVREFDVDGFRIDAIWGIKERNPEWLALYLREMRRLKPDMLLIAEASARDPFYAEHGFDAAFDWTGQLGQWAWEGIFDGSAPIGQAMVAALTDGGRGYHEDALPLRFLNNNDTGPRFLTTHGMGCYRVALAMLLTLPGLPCLFTGDEVGATYLPYAQRGPIDWTDRAGLRDFTRKLIGLRRGTPAFHSRHWTPLEVEPAAPFLGYTRTDEEGLSPVIVLLNFTADDLEATATLPEAVAATFNGELTDLWSGDPVAAASDGRVTAPIPGWEFRFLVHSNG